MSKNTKKYVKSGLIVVGAIAIAPIVINIAVAVTVTVVTWKMISITSELVAEQFKDQDQKIA